MENLVEQWLNWPNWSLLLSLFVPTATGSLFGAYCAYRLESKRRRKELVEGNILAGKMAVFEHVRIHDKFSGILNTHIKEYQHHLHRHLVIPPVIGVTGCDAKFDWVSLVFLSHSYTDLLRDISNFEQEVRSTIELIIERSKRHHDIVQPAAESAGLLTGGLIDYATIENQIGPKETITIKGLTDQMVESVQDILCMVPNNVNRIELAIKEMYPKY